MVTHPLFSYDKPHLWPNKWWKCPTINILLLGKVFDSFIGRSVYWLLNTKTASLYERLKKPPPTTSFKDQSFGSRVSITQGTIFFWIMFAHSWVLGDGLFYPCTHGHEKMCGERKQLPFYFSVYFEGSPAAEEPWGIMPRKRPHGNTLGCPSLGRTHSNWNLPFSKMWKHLKTCS